MVLRRIVILAALAVLGACNMVVTKDPVFSRSDARGAPAMRPGVWIGEPASGCELDESRPLADWPDCANGYVVENDHRLGSFNDERGKHAWTTIDFVLAAGNPQVFQIHITGDDPVMPSAYVYAGLEPTKLDDAGRIVAARSWIVICGPPPPVASGTDGSGSKSHAGTLHPFTGLSMDSDGVNCTPGSPAALFNAARQSRELAAPKEISSAHWVRDGDR